MANERVTPTIDDLIALPQLDNAQMSPDGRFIVYTISTPEWKDNYYLTQLWLVETDGNGKPRQLTFAKQSSYSPRWSADGQWLAFLSRRVGDRATQVYRLSAQGGEAERLTDIETDVQAFRWSPDGRFIAYTTSETKSEEERKREESFGDFHVEDEDHRLSHLWSFRLADKKPRKLTGGKSFHVVEFNWSPDSQQLVFQANASPDAKDLDRGQIYTVNLSDLSIIVLTPPGYSAPRWSPDGTMIVCLREGEAYYQINQLTLLSPATHEIRDLGNPLDDEILLGVWGSDGIYFRAIRGTAEHLFRLEPNDGAAIQITPDPPEGWVTLATSFSADSTKAALIVMDAIRYTEVAVLDLTDGSCRYLTNYSDQVKHWPLPQPENFQWHSADGTLIEGVLTKPNNFDPEQKYPFFVVIHGGPAGVSLRSLLSYAERRIYPTQLWLAKNAIILQPNYRGSIGYGGRFKALNVRNLGIGDYEDVISGVDALIAQGWVDPERVGVMGWSQGGYISAFITTYSDRFRATSVGAGISNWMTYYVNTDIHPFTRHYLQASPWDDPEIYAATSPMTYIKQAKTPALIQHGSRDGRVPVPNAFELYQGLQDMNVPVRLVTYPGMGHAPTKPRQSRQIMQDNLDWFNKWVLGEETNKEAEKLCYVVFGALSQQEEVFNWARRDRADFRVFSGEAGLLDVTPSEELPELHIDALSTLAQQVAEQLRAELWKKVVIHTPDPKKQVNVLIILGCLQAAAGLVGGITVQHQELPDLLVTAKAAEER